MVGRGEGTPPNRGRGLGRELYPSPENFRFWILNRRIVVKTECNLYRSPKAGLNAVYVLGIGEGQKPRDFPLRWPCLNCRDFALLDSLHLFIIESIANCELGLSRGVFKKV